MKKSIINKLYFGQRGDGVTILTEKENSLLDEAVKYEKLIVKELSSEHLELHKKFEQTLNDLSEEETRKHYVEGFKLGLLIGIECMEE